MENTIWFDIKKAVSLTGQSENTIRDYVKINRDESFVRRTIVQRWIDKKTGEERTTEKWEISKEGLIIKFPLIHSPIDFGTAPIVEDGSKGTTPTGSRGGGER